MARKWTPEEILTITRSFQPACVIFAAADLDVFSVFSGTPLDASTISNKLETDLRATTVLLDALAALELLNKQNDKYSISPETAEMLTGNGQKSIIGGIRHLANCMRRWIQLPQVVKSGKPAQHIPSIRGANEDEAAFIQAMDNFSVPIADNLIRKIQPLNFSRLLDVGGASGTWTIAFLKAVPDSKATIFDLSEVIPMARKRIAKAGLTDRVTFAEGDLYKDKLPKGADFVWLSAIAHMNSREQNQQMFIKIYSAMQNNSTLVMRDIIMDDSRTEPQTGALFAINMLTSTDGGGTYTFDEYSDDLLNAGFSNVDLIYNEHSMNSLVSAKKQK